MNEACVVPAVAPARRARHSRHPDQDAMRLAVFGWLGTLGAGALLWAGLAAALL